MSALLRRARPLSWAKTAERRAALLPSVTEVRRPFGTVKAILTDDVSGTGYRGEYVEIRGGFMRNFLFPNKRAIYATDENRAAYEAIDRTAEKERVEALKALKRGRQELSGIPIILKRNLPTGGKGGIPVGQAVRAKDVSDYLRKNSPFDVTEEDVRLPGSGKPVSTVGTHAVLVRTQLSESASAILVEEFGGAKELEEEAWVRMELIVEQTQAAGKEGGGKGKRNRGDAEEEAAESEGGGDAEGEEEEKGEEEGGKSARDMSV
ncbi:unnamed protein product [Scytosiphon promiscuus]